MWTIIFISLYQKYQSWPILYATFESPLETAVDHFFWFLGRTGQSNTPYLGENITWKDVECFKQKAAIYRQSKIQLQIVTGGFTSWLNLPLTEISVGLQCCGEIEYSFGCGDILPSGVISCNDAVKDFCNGKISKRCNFHLSPFSSLAIASLPLLYQGGHRHPIKSNQIKSKVKNLSFW